MTRIIQALAALGVVLLVVAGWLHLTGSSESSQAEQPTQSSSTSTPSASSPTSTSSGWTVNPSPVGEKSSESSSTSTPSASSPTSTRTTSPSSTSAKEAAAKKAAKAKKAKVRAERGRAVSAARSFLTDLTDRERDPKAWWAKVESHLAPQARTDMKGMEPDWIPPIRLKPGGGVVEDSPDAPQDESGHGESLTTEVQVPTDSGWVTVMLHPDSGGEGYQVTRYRLPEDL